MKFLIGLIILIHGYGCTVANAANVSPAFTIPKAYWDGKPKIVTWSLASSSDTVLPAETIGAEVISFQTSGTFNSGNVILEVSNDGVTYYAAQDLNGTAVSGTTAIFKTIRDHGRYMRARTTVVGSQDVTATLYLAK